MKNSKKRCCPPEVWAVSSPPLNLPSAPLPTPPSLPYFCPTFHPTPPHRSIRCQLRGTGCDGTPHSFFNAPSVSTPPGLTSTAPQANGLLSFQGFFSFFFFS
ncbi:uncharacterized [Lates japonicus]